MKNIKLFLLTLVLLLSFVISSEARTDKAYWIWSTAVTGVNDAPDKVYASMDGNKYVSVGAGYIQPSSGASSVTIQTDSATGEGSNTIGGLHNDITDATVICSNTATAWDLNVLACLGGTCDTGTGTSAFHMQTSLDDALIDSFPLEDIDDGFQLTVDENAGTNACIVVRTTVIW
ncbi:hypothetical protein LCGC14_0945640 [marine sediment metagenome]|uniref:Uncharacterized protein n=1 Tax=marine sediment metagenome TaxID=412755 RepID=A0A0F9P4W6_9ZZZZ